MLEKNGSVRAMEALRSRFDGVLDIDGVLDYDFDDFFDFCQCWGYFGYKADGVEGRLQSPEEFVRHRKGNCWDQTELQRSWFERHGYEAKTYLLYYYLRDDCCPSHSILVYKESGVWYWFEPMFHGTAVEYSGVHRYTSEEELLADFKRVFSLNSQKTETLPESLEERKWALYEYSRPRFGICDYEFYEHCRKGRRVW